ncbi:MAG: hypothetical protein AAF998_24085 [Bacteroidota bacterium]
MPLLRLQAASDPAGRHREILKISEPQPGAFAGSRRLPNTQAVDALGHGAQVNHQAARAGLRNTSGWPARSETVSRIAAADGLPIRKLIGESVGDGLGK